MPDASRDSSLPPLTVDTEVAAQCTIALRVSSLSSVCWVLRLRRSAMDALRDSSLPNTWGSRPAAQCSLYGTGRQQLAPSKDGRSSTYKSHGSA